MITGRGNGQSGREHGREVRSVRGAASQIQRREHVAKVWGIRPDDSASGLRAVEIMEAIHRGEIKALISMCFNPLVSLPDANFTREALEKLGSSVSWISSSETASR
jgi:assimilatory nitrate reductase catalytic subunit